MDRSSLDLEAGSQLGAAEASGQEARTLAKTNKAGMIMKTSHAKTLESLLHACSYMASSVPAGRSAQANISLGPSVPRPFVEGDLRCLALQMHLGLFFRW